MRRKGYSDTALLTQSGLGQRPRSVQDKLGVARSTRNRFLTTLEFNARSIAGRNKVGATTGVGVSASPTLALIDSRFAKLFRLVSARDDWTSQTPPRQRLSKHSNQSSFLSLSTPNSTNAGLEV